LGEPAPVRLVFTDLDATLLDRETYLWDEAAPALAACRERGIPVILVSSKTRAEMEVVSRNLGLSEHPFVTENGGGVVFPLAGPLAPPPEARQERDVFVLSQGTPYPELVRALNAIRGELGLSITGFSDLTPAQLAGMTGLSEAEAGLAAQRNFDEPFFAISPVDLAAFTRQSVRLGLAVTPGGRFSHLHGQNDKGRAVGRLLSLYARLGPVVSMALGDADNDLPMLQAVDFPVWLGDPGRAPDLPGLSTPPHPGPRGWNLAVSSFLLQTDPRVSGWT